MYHHGYLLSVSVNQLTAFSMYSIFYYLLLLKYFFFPDSAIILSQHGCMQTVGKVWRARYLIGRDYRFE